MAECLAAAAASVPGRVAVSPPCHLSVLPDAPEGWQRDQELKEALDAAQAAPEEGGSAAGHPSAPVAPGLFFGRQGLTRGPPHAGGHRPVQRQRRDQERARQAVRAPERAVLRTEAPGLEVGG